MKLLLFLLLLLVVFPALSSDDEPVFTNGPIIANYGINTTVDQTWPISKDTEFKVTFDIAEAAEPGKLNQKINSLARFINMHSRAGVKPEKIHLAMVVHGKALNDLLTKDVFFKLFNTENKNVELLTILMSQNVQVIVCGQSAAYYKIDSEDFLPGVKVALSAMTAHAILQQQGYTLNPF